MTKFIYLSSLFALLFISETVCGESFRWTEDRNGMTRDVRCSCAHEKPFRNPCPHCPVGGKRNFLYETQPRYRRKEEPQMVNGDELNYVGRLIGEYLRLREADYY